MTSKGSFDAQLTADVGSIQKAIAGKSPPKLYEATKILMQSINNACQTNSINTQDFIKLISMVRDIIIASATTVAYNQPEWVSTRHQLYRAIGNGASLSKGPFKGAILSIIQAFETLGSTSRIDTVVDILRGVITSPPESTNKFDLLKFELSLVYFQYASDVVISQSAEFSTSSQEFAMVEFFSSFGDYVVTQMNLVTDDTSIRSRKLKCLQKTIQGLFMVYDAFSINNRIVFCTIGSAVGALCQGFVNLLSELSSWDQLLKSIYTIIKRRLGNENNEIEYLAILIQNLSFLFEGFSAQISAIRANKNDGNTTCEDIVKILVYISQLFVDLKVNENSSHLSVGLAQFHWRAAIFLYKTFEQRLSPCQGVDFYEKLNKLLQCAAFHTLNATTPTITGNMRPNQHLETAPLTIWSLFLSHIKKEALKLDSKHKLGADNILAICSLGSSNKLMKKLIQLAFDILFCSPADSIDDLLLIQRDIVSCFATKIAVSAEEDIVRQYLVSWWNEEVLLSRFVCSSSKLFVQAQIPQPMILPGSYLCMQWMLNGSSTCLPSSPSLPSMSILSDLQSLWCTSDISKLSICQDDIFSEEYTAMARCLATTMAYLQGSRQWHRSIPSSSTAKYIPTLQWEDITSKESYLSMVESTLEQVKSSHFQPFVDYYLVKSLFWLCASKICWFYYDDLMAADACAKKSYSYAHNRSVEDGAMTRWVRIESLLFSAEVAENLGKTSRAVDNLAEAWQLASSLVSQNECLTRVLTHAIRFWLRIDSSRIQELVSTQLPVFFGSSSSISTITSTCAWLAQYFPAIATKLEKEISINTLLPKTQQSQLSRPKLFDIDILWQRSCMEDPSSTADSFTDLRFSSPAQMLKYSFQCPFPATRHLRKAASIGFLSASPSVDEETRMLQAFVTGASSSFVTLERSNYLSFSATNTSHSSSSSTQGLPDSVKLIQECLLSPPASSSSSGTELRDWLDKLTALPTAPSSSQPRDASLPQQIQLCFLTCDFSTDRIIAGSYRQNSQRDIHVQEILGGKALFSLATRWRDMLDSHHQQLRRTKDLATVTQMTEKEKKQWWKQREQMESDIESLLSECESLVTPVLSSLLSPVLATNISNITAPPTTVTKKKSVSIIAQPTTAQPNAASMSTMKKPITTAKKMKKDVITTTTQEDDDLAYSMKKLRFAEEEKDEIDLNIPRFRDIDNSYDEDDELNNAHDEFDRLVSMAAHDTATNDADSSSVVSPLTLPSSPLPANENIPSDNNVNANTAVAIQLELEALKVNDLKQLCKDANVAVTGKKSDLIDRLVEYRLQRASTVPPASSSSSIPLTLPQAPATVTKKGMKSISSKKKDDAHHIELSTAAAPTPCKTHLPPPAMTPSLTSTTAKKPQFAAATTGGLTTATKSKPGLLMTAQKSAGKRLIDVFCDDEDDKDFTMSHLSSKKNTQKPNTKRTAIDGSALPISSAAQQYHTILIVDETLQQLPLESMPSLQNLSVSRMLSLPLLLDTLRRRSSRSSSGSSGVEKTEENGSKAAASRKKGAPTRPTDATSVDSHPHWYKMIEATRSWYALDADNNLPTTRATLLPLLQEAETRLSWSGFVGEVPSADVIRENQRENDVFVYCGHGAGVPFHGINHCTSGDTTNLPAALLWGCSSGRLLSRGEHDPMGPVLTYLCHGAPYFVLGNLWDVTDRDLDRLTIEVMRNIFHLTTNPLLPPTHASSALVSTKKVLFQDDDDDGEEVAGAKAGKVENASMVPLAPCLATARGVCRMRYAVGAAAVLYGIPVPVSFNS